MQLKTYQEKVLEKLDRYLETLAAKRDEVEEYAAFQRSRGRTVDVRDFCEDTWNALNAAGLLPTFRDQRGAVHVPHFVERRDGLERPIPNICFKVPTAGGKTLLAAHALERIAIDYFRAQTGFVLWVVPSDAIYRQTWKQLANREHPYRQILERASGGRVKLLEKGDNFTDRDVAEYLCVMVLMLQSSARQTKEQLRLFRDTGRFSSFFPDVDDDPANRALLAATPNLEVNAGDELLPEPLRGLSLKHSLGNVLRIVRPIVLIDEGHRAYSDIARTTLASFNPRFLLELSATPNIRQWHSNILVDVPGTALKDAQMIKLPINIANFANADWKHTLTQAKEKLEVLEREAQALHGREGYYLRPIMLVRVDRTGKEQRDGIHVHAEDARAYLIDRLGVRPDAIRVKSASTDELGDEDLRSELCPVRYIITKDALREGWDCPFAYILTILSKTTAPTAMTQMIGRVLRQPGARATSIPKLNECYIFCFDQEVKEAVESVRKGLEEEGMSGLAQDVRSLMGDGDHVKAVSVPRAPRFRNVQILLPRVLYRDAGGLRPLDYDRDILGALAWSRLSYTGGERFTPDDRDRLERTLVSVTLANHDGQLALPLLHPIRREEEVSSLDLDFPFLVRQLMDVVPNPWQAVRILEETLETLEERGIARERIYGNRLFLLSEMRRDLAAQVDAASEALFRAKLSAGEIVFRLVSTNDPALNWKLAETLELTVRDDDRTLRRKDDNALERALFERVYERDFNSLERDVAWYLDEVDAVAWWHRLVAKQDYHLQGWQKYKIYPDFLACLRSDERGRHTFTVLETKGAQLKGNDDTAYKTKLFDLLGECYNKSLDAGEVQISGSNNQQMIFKIVMQDSWRDDVMHALAQ